MRTFLSSAPVLMLCALAACSDVKPDAYNQADVEIISKEMKRHELVITYRPPSESLYYSPGAQVVGNGKTTEITLVRCRIKGKCPVNASGITPSAGVVQVKIPYTGLPLVIAFKDVRAQIKP